MTSLLFADPLQRSLDRRHGVRRMDEREGPQGEAVRQKASEDVRKLQALRTAHDPDEHQQQRDHEPDRPRARPPVRPARDHARDGIKRSDPRDNRHEVDSPSFPSPRAFSGGRVLGCSTAVYPAWVHGCLTREPRMMSVEADHVRLRMTHTRARLAARQRL